MRLLSVHRRIFLIKLVLISLPFGSIKIIWPQLNLPTFIFFLYLVLFTFTKVKSFHYKPIFKQFIIISSLYILILVVSLMNITPYEGGFSILRQMPIYLVLFYFISNEIFYRNISRNEFMQSYVLGVMILITIYLLGINVSVDHLGRESIMNINPNTVGMISGLSILMIIDLLRSKKPYFWVKILYITSIPFLLFMIIQTGSRGGVIGLLIGIIVFFYFTKSAILRKYTLAFITILLLGTVFLSNELLYDRFFSKEETLTDSRLPLWENVIDIVDKEWLFGVGIFRYYTEIEILRGRAISTHNEFLSVFVYSGLVGLLLFILFLYNIFKTTSLANAHINNPVLMSLLFIIIFTLSKGGGALLSMHVWLVLSLVYATSLCVLKDHEITTKQWDVN